MPLHLPGFSHGLFAILIFPDHRQRQGTPAQRFQLLQPLHISDPNKWSDCGEGAVLLNAHLFRNGRETLALTEEARLNHQMSPHEEDIKLEV